MEKELVTTHIEKSESEKMKKQKYEKPKIEIITVSSEKVFCVSGKIGDWKLDEDSSGDDDWSDNSNPNNAKLRNLWED